jgi:hypothetical protein
VARELNAARVNIHIVYMDAWMTVSGISRYFIKQEDSQLSEINSL